MTKEWQELADKVKEGQILDRLIALNLQAADPAFSDRFTEAKAGTTDPANCMRLELQMFNRVVELRKEGKMLPVEELKLKAKTMVGLSSDEMARTFFEFSQELRQS